MPDTATERPLRICDVCKSVDDHPRHTQAVPPGTTDGVPTQEFIDSLGEVPASAVALLLNPGLVIRHMDCCAALGCELCQETEGITNGARGAKLIEVLDPARKGLLADHEPSSYDTNEATGLIGKVTNDG